MNSHNNSENRRVDVITKFFYPIGGGIENNIMQTYSVLHTEFGWDVTIHTSKDTYTEKNILPELEVLNGLTVKRYPVGIFGFRPAISWDHADVVALHNFDIFFVRYMCLALFRKLFRRKTFALILTPHGGFSPEWSMFNIFSRYIKKLYTYTLGAWLINATVDGVRAVSQWEQSEEIKFINPKRVHLIDNGLENEAYSDIDALASTDVKSAVEGYGKYIIQIARVYPIKNIETTIRALAHVPGDLKFVLLGELQDPQYEQKLRSLVRTLGLEQRVVMRGVIRGVDKYYLLRHAVAMVHMALWESGCNAVREGMSQGLPCIVSNTYGLPGLVKTGVNGFCLPVMDDKGVAEKILWVLNPDNTAAVHEMREANIIFGKGQSWREVAKKMDALYRLCVSRVQSNIGVTHEYTKASYYSVTTIFRNCMYELGLLLTPLFARRKPSLVVYCYHSISDDDWKYSVSKEAFKAQIEFLLSQATPFDPKNIGAYLEGTYTLQSDAFLITFDDGYQDILAVKDFLAEQKITPIVFVLSHAERADREELETNRPFLSSAEIRRLHTEGWVIGSHSATHPDFTDLDSSRMEDEIVGSRHSLGQMIGSTVNLFAYPKGAYSTALCGAVRDAGYAVAFSVDDGYVEPQGNSYTIPRVGVDGTHHMRQFKSLALPGSMWLRGSVRKIVSLFAQSRI